MVLCNFRLSLALRVSHIEVNDKLSIVIALPEPKHFFVLYDQKPRRNFQ